MQHSGMSSITEHGARSTAVDDWERPGTLPITLLELNTTSNVASLGQETEKR